MELGKIVLYATHLCAAGSLAAGVSAWAAAPAVDAVAEGDGYRVLPLVEITGQPGARLQWQDPREAYFGLGDRYLFATDKFLTVHVAAPDGAAPRTDNGLANLSGSVGYDVGPHRFGIPIVHQTYQTDDGARRFDAYGLEWRRRFGAAHELALSARRGEHGALDGNARDSSTGNVAQLAWSSAFAGNYQPRVMGSVFLGDESAKDKGPRWFGRKYFGLSLDGSFTAFEKHTPYASLLLQRSDYDATETSLSAARREDYSRLAAGWNWQVRPNWGLRAEANYVLNTSGQPGYDYERSQLLFSTRFGFK
jgi:hypothetical protein